MRPYTTAFENEAGVSLSMAVSRTWPSMVNAPA